MKFSPAEKKLWACAERGETADFRTDQERDRLHEWQPSIDDARGWGADRTVRAAVIHELWRLGYPVRMVGCMVQGAISTSRTAEVSFSADRTIFMEYALFGRTIFTEDARFNGALFVEPALFDGATFTQEAVFEGAAFAKDALFDGATFTQAAVFNGAAFAKDALFDRATFTQAAVFEGAAFAKDALFGRATFTRGAVFEGATFTRGALFDEAIFIKAARFDRAAFTGAVSFAAVWARKLNFTQARITGGTEVVSATGLRAEIIDLSGAIIEAAVHLDLSAKTIVAQRTRVARYSQLRMRCQSADFADADLGEHCLLAEVGAAPSSGASMHLERWHPDPVVLAKINELDKRLTVVIPAKAALLSLERAVVAGVTVSGLDLTGCRFHGAHGLDKLRVDPGCSFASSREALATPAPWVGRRLLARRRIIADETLVPGRAKPAPNPPSEPVPDPPATSSAEGEPSVHAEPLGAQPVQAPTVAAEPDGSQSEAAPSVDAPPEEPPRTETQPVETRTPGEVAETYRALRKSMEDAKNEPGAADFYYGEMEMRRRTKDRGSVERALIASYWAVSGYGLRASRALIVLAALIVVATGVFMQQDWATVTKSYYPADQPSTVELHAGRDLTVMGTVTVQEPEKRSLTLGEAAQFSLREAVALIRPASDNRFRPHGLGVVVDIALRILGPTLIALAVLAIRARTKR